MPANQNITDPAVGAFPMTPLHQFAAQSVVTPDDDGHYEDKGTQRTHELVTMSHNRNSPRKANGSSNSSPNRTESTFTGSSGVSPFVSDDDENGDKTQQQHDMYVTPPRRSILPLLPQRSDAKSNPFAPNPVSVEEDQEEKNAMYTSSVSVSTMSSAASSREGSYRVLRKRATEESSQEDGTSPSAAVDSGDDEFLEPPPRRLLFQDENAQQGGEASTQEGPVTVSAASSKEILALEASLISMQKIMSTLQGELRRRNNSEKANRNTTRTYPRSSKQKLPTKKGTMGLRFREHMECLILSDDKSEDDSLSSVPEEEASVMRRGADAALTSQMVQVVQSIPPCDTANLLIRLRRNQESWSITSAEVKSSSKRLNFV